MKKFIKEFRSFAVKGNVIDLAVAVIIGGAFGKIVSSFVADVIMPPISLLLGGTNLTDRSIILKDGAESISPVTLNFGSFLQNVLDFLIIALVIFLMIKFILVLKRQAGLDDAPEKKSPPTPSKEQELLAEIRDLLKERSKQ